MTILMLVFLFLAILSFAELFLGKPKRLKFFWNIPLIIILLVLTTIRGGMRGDYVSYKENYLYITNTSNLFVKENFYFEPLYSLLQWVCRKITDNFQIFLLVLGIIVIYLETCFATYFSVKGEDHSKKSNTKRFYFTVLFVMWGLYLAGIFVIRSTIALMICLYSARYIEEKKAKKFLLCVLLATGFHVSALVFLPAYFIFWRKTNLKTKINFLVFGSFILIISIRPLALIAGNIFGGIIEYKIIQYLNATDFLWGTGMDAGSALPSLVKTLLNIGVLLIVGIYFWNFNKNCRFYEGYLNLYICGCVLYLATLTIGQAFARLSIYYNVFQVPILLYALEGNKKSNNNRKIYWLILVIYLLVRFLANNIGIPFITYWQ